MKRCLIVVDYQPDFVAGKHGFPEARAIEMAVADKIRAYHAAGDDVLVTLDRAAEPVLYGAAGRAMQKTDRQFLKSCYGSGALYAYLQRVPYASIELAGVESHVCVLACAVLAQTAQPDTPVLLDRGCIAGPDDALHRAALMLLQGIKMEIAGEN